jgi:hypothetical protein
MLAAVCLGKPYPATGLAVRSSMLMPARECFSQAGFDLTALDESTLRDDSRTERKKNSQVMKSIS